MEGTFNFIGKTSDARSGAALSPSFSTGNVDVRHFDAGTMAFNSVNYNLRSMTFSCDNKVERRDLLGSKQSAQMGTTDIKEVTLECTADLEDNNIYNAQLDGTAGDVVISFSQGTGAAAHSFEITLNAAQIIDYSDNISSVGRIERTFTFQGFADLNTSPSDAFKIVIVNSENSGKAN